VLEFYEGITDGQQLALFIGTFALLGFALRALGKILNRLINYFIQLVRSNTDRLDGHDIEHSTSEFRHDRTDARLKEHDEQINEIRREK